MPHDSVSSFSTSIRHSSPSALTTSSVRSSSPAVKNLKSSASRTRRPLIVQTRSPAASSSSAASESGSTSMILIPFAIDQTSQEMFCRKSAGTKRDRCLGLVVAILLCRTLEKLADAAAKAGQQVFARQFIVFRQHRQLQWRAIDHHDFVFGRDPPDPLHAGGKVLLRFSDQLVEDVVRRNDFHRQVGSEWPLGFRLTFRRNAVNRNDGSHNHTSNQISSS